MGVVASVAKGLSGKPLLRCALMTLCFAFLKLRCDLSLSHVADVRNEEADYFGRLNDPWRSASKELDTKFSAENRIVLSGRYFLGPRREFLEHGPKCLSSRADPEA